DDFFISRPNSPQIYNNLNEESLENEKKSNSLDYLSSEAKEEILGSTSATVSKNKTVLDRKRILS
ncbi:8350_t:CDS:1, partial [Racocetra fulgida]